MPLAAVLTEYNSDLALWDITHGFPGLGQVTVKMISAGICGAQLQEIRGNKGSHLPRLIGHEGVGLITDIGAGVTTVSIGDKVVLHWRPGHGIESAPPTWSHYTNTHTSGLVTTLLEETVVSENRCTRVPAHAPNDLCVLLGCGLSTALGVIEHDAKLQFGEHVLVIGFGGVGSCLVAAAKARGAGIIGVLDPVNKSASAFELGATGYWQELGLNSWETAFDVIIDTTGNSDMIEVGIDHLAPSGRFVLVGQPTKRNSFTVANACHLFEGRGKTILASQGGGFFPALDIPRYLAMYQTSNIRLDRIITHRFRLPQINEAIELMKRGEAGRILIDF